MSFYRWFACIVLVFILGIPVLAVSLLASEVGSRWILSQGQQYLSFDIRYDEFHGSLLDEFRFENFAFQNERFLYNPKELKIDWQPLALLSGTLQFRKIESIGGEIRVRSSAEANTEASSGSIKDLSIKLPLRVELDRLLVQQSQFFILDAPPQTLDASAAGTVTAEGLVKIVRFRLEHQYLTSSISGTTKLSYPFETEIKNDTRLHSPDYPTLKIISQVSGDIEMLVTKSTLSKGLNGTVESEIRQPLENFNWQVNSQWQENQLAGWIKSVTDLGLSFRGALQGHGTLKQATLEPDILITANKQTAEIDGKILYKNNVVNFVPLLIQPQDLINGKIALNGKISSISTSPVINAALTWDKVIYQPNTIISRDGKLVAQGPLNDLAIQLSSDLSGFLGQQLSVVASAQLVPNQLNVSKWKFSQLEQGINGSALISWQDGLALTTRFSGNYQQRPVDGEIKLRMLSPYLYVDQFDTRWGAQSFNAKGALSPGKTLRWQLASDNLSAILPIDGSAIAAGTINGSLAQPAFKIGIDEFRLQPSDYALINLEQPVTATVNHQDFTFEVSPVCVVYGEVSTPVCVEAKQRENAVSFQANADKVPLSLLQSLALPNAPYRFDGALALDIDGLFNYQNMMFEELSGFINADNSTLQAAGETITLEQLNVTAKSRDKSGIDFQLAANAEELSFNLQGALSIAKIASQSPLSGRINLSSESLEFFNLLLPQMDIDGGHANANLDIAGQLNDPTVSGEVSLLAEKVVVLSSGTLISNLHANLTANSREGQFTVDANGTVGAGDVVIEGELNAFDRTGLLTIRGNDLLIMDTPSLLLMASPDMSIELNKDLISLTGDLTVPKATVTPIELDKAVTVSDDIVLKNEKKEKSLLKTQIDVTVNLGENVRLEALGFSGNLQGKLNITRQPNSIPQGNGRIGVVSGKYEIYGQELTIENGDLIFNGGPLYSPTLNLRVTRNIEQSSVQQDVPEQIGARVTGTIEQPELHLFSTPPLPDSTILSYLLFGKPPGSQGAVNNLELQAALLVGGRSTEFLTEEIKDTFDLDEVALESTTSDINDTSLYIGKYLSPRLYVKYGIGLIESTSTFILRYSLSENLIFESTSTTEGQGGDLIYTIEN